MNSTNSVSNSMTTGVSRNDYWRLIIFVGLFVSAWVIFAVMSKPGLDRYGDMVENFAWGQEWQWGYYKHPPLFAWISAAWFQVFPFGDAWFYLLSYINVVAALLVQWRLAARVFCHYSARSAVVLCVFLPTVTFLAAKYNANAALLLWWPLTTLLLLYSIERHRWVYSVGLGLSAAAAVLSKYYSLVLLATMGLYCLIHARAYLRTPFPYVALLVFALALIPHVVWLVDNDFLTLRYVGQQEGDSWSDVFKRALLKFPLIQFGYALLPAAVAYYFLRPSRRQMKRNVTAVWQEQPWLFWFGLGPLLVACVVAIATKTSLSTPWSIPHGFLLTVLLLRLMQVKSDEQNARQLWLKLWRVAVVYLLLVMGVAAPVGWQNAQQLKSGAAIPYAKINSWLDERWSDHTPKPLTLVVGRVIASGVAFYSQGQKHAVYLPLEHSPWVSKAMLNTRGFVAVCERTDQKCLDAVAVLNERWTPSSVANFQLTPDAFWGTPQAPFEGLAWFYAPSSSVGREL